MKKSICLCLPQPCKKNHRKHIDKAFKSESSSLDLKKIAENDKAVFYTNIFCKDFDDGYKIIIAEQKSNGYKEYLLLDGNNYVYGSQKIEDVYSKHDILKLLKEKS